LSIKYGSKKIEFIRPYTSALSMLFTTTTDPLTIAGVAAAEGFETGSDVRAPAKPKTAIGAGKEPESIPLWVRRSSTPGGLKATLTTRISAR
jgi:hypothetical protein